jgi:hypothetical protein
MTMELATISRTPLSGLLNTPRATMSAMMMKVRMKAQAAAMIIMNLAALSLNLLIDIFRLCVLMPGLRRACALRAGIRMRRPRLDGNPPDGTARFQRSAGG